MTAYIFGSGGHAYVIASVVDTDAVFLVEHDPSAGQMREEEFFSRAEQFSKAPIYIGIGDNVVRRRIYEKLARCGLPVANCISKHSFVARNAQIGSGVVILPGSVIGARAVIGNNTIVNTLSSVDHDCTLGAHSQVTAGVIFGGTVRTGENCFFGIRSGVIPNKTLGNNVTVMAGALVVNDVPDNVLLGGSPARIMKGQGPN